MNLLTLKTIVLLCNCPRERKEKIMEFILMYDWIDEDNGYVYERNFNAYATKEELFEAKKEVEERYKWQIEIGRLILSPAIGYSWADLDRLF
jgi:hypothetical protein